uniref:COMM domain-containing protein 3 n=1 Tax=Sphenodon punctatus TaxID=8508 RepID=A0A8D0LB22_SPHPU
MELSEYVQRGLQILADPACFPPTAYTILLQTAFQSLFNAQTDQAALDHADLKHIDPTVLKHCHSAAVACIVEVGKQKVDKSALSTYLEDCKFDRERIEQFCTEYQKNKDTLEIILGSIGRCPLYITDVSWRLEYQIKNNDTRSYPDISFSCTMEQLQDLVGKLKDASKQLLCYSFLFVLL